MFSKNTFLKWKINKLKIHLFEKTYKKGFSNFIFTVWVQSEKWELLGKKVPAKILENPSDEIENRQLQVIHDLLILHFIHLHFIFRL